MLKLLAEREFAEIKVEKGNKVVIESVNNINRALSYQFDQANKTA